MKRTFGFLLVIIALLLASAALADVPLDEAHFPDPRFRALVGDYDTDDNQVLSTQEVAEAQDLYLVWAGIKSLKGIEYLTEARSISCDDNELTELDVSQNKKLETLYCGSNRLNKLNVGKNGNLRNLYCGSNCLTHLDVSGAPALEVLECDRNQLTVLDVSKNQKLQALFCKQNQLTSLDLSRNPEIEMLYCGENRLTELHVGRLWRLVSLQCEKNALTSLELSWNKGLFEVQCEGNALTSLGLGRQDDLASLSCYDNQIEWLDLSQCPLLMEYCENHERAAAPDAAYDGWTMAYKDLKVDPETRIRAEIPEKDATEKTQYTTGYIFVVDTSALYTTTERGPETIRQLLGNEKTPALLSMLREEDRIAFLWTDDAPETGLGLAPLTDLNAGSAAYTERYHAFAKDRERQKSIFDKALEAYHLVINGSRECSDYRIIVISDFASDLGNLGGYQEKWRLMTQDTDITMNAIRVYNSGADDSKARTAFGASVIQGAAEGTGGFYEEVNYQSSFSIEGQIEVIVRDLVHPL